MAAIQRLTLLHINSARPCSIFFRGIKLHGKLSSPPDEKSISAKSSSGRNELTVRLDFVDVLAERTMDWDGTGHFKAWFAC